MDAEYKFIIDTPKQIQNMLNQWRHSYIIKIIAVNKHDDDQYAVILKRIRKQTINETP